MCRLQPTREGDTVRREVVDRFAGPAALRVVWTAPSFTGTDPITGYEARALNTTAAIPTATATVEPNVTEVTLEPLTDGVLYEVAVRAIAGDLTSPYSEVVEKAPDPEGNTLPPGPGTGGGGGGGGTPTPQPPAPVIIDLVDHAFPETFHFTPRFFGLTAEEAQAQGGEPA